MLQNATPLNISDEHVSCLGFTSHCRRFTSLPQKRLRSLLYCARNAKSNVPHLPSFWICYKTVTFCSLWQGAESLSPATQNDASTSKSGVLLFLAFWLRISSKCASRHNGAPLRHPNFQKCSEAEVLCKFWLRNVLRATTAKHFLNISTSKSNFQKCSEREMFLAFSLANVLRATTACNFSSLISPDGSAPAALASLLFDPPEPQIIGKTQCFATFLPFPAPASSFFWLFLFSGLLSSSLLFSSPICPYCRKFGF